MGWLLLSSIPVAMVHGQDAGTTQRGSSEAALSATASQAAPEVERLLPELWEYARQYRAQLPSLSCKESILSQRVTTGVVRDETRIESTLRVLRVEGGPEPFSEKLQFLSVDGHAVPSRIRIPLLVQGGFANAMGFAEGASTAACYDYKVSRLDSGRNLRLDMALRLNDADPACKKIAEGFRKTVLVDAASGRITYVERTISAKAAKDRKEIFFATMEFGPQRIGNEMLWLPVKMTAHDDKDEGRMAITFSDYHRYAASSTIVPASPVN